MFENKLNPKPVKKEKNPYGFSTQSYDKARNEYCAGVDYGEGYTNPLSTGQEPLQRGAKRFNVDL